MLEIPITLENIMHHDFRVKVRGKRALAVCTAAEFMHQAWMNREKPNSKGIAINRLRERMKVMLRHPKILNTVQSGILEL